MDVGGRGRGVLSTGRRRCQSTSSCLQITLLSEILLLNYKLKIGQLRDAIVTLSEGQGPSD